MRKYSWQRHGALVACAAYMLVGTTAQAEVAPAAHADTPKVPTAPTVPKVPASPDVPVARGPENKAEPIVSSAAPKAASPPVATSAPATEATKTEPQEPAAKAAKHHYERPSLPAHDSEHKAVDHKDPAPPSLTLEALAAEISNSPAEIERNNLLKEREHIGELAGALDIAQKQLRQDTERLAAYLDEVRKQTDEVKVKRQSDREAATKADVAAKEVKISTGPAPATPLEVLAKAMKGMKAAQAAAIAERLPVSLAGDVVERMPSRDAGKMMGLMNPERAAALASEIAAREERHKRAIK